MIGGSPLNVLNYAPGLYVVRRAVHNSPGALHYAILDIGNNYPIPDAISPAPKLIHQCPPRLQWCWFEEADAWEMYGHCVDLPGAIERITWLAANDPEYDLMLNNCEHFVNLAANGQKRSVQLELALLFTASVGLLFMVLRRG